MVRVFPDDGEYASDNESDKHSDSGFVFRSLNGDDICLAGNCDFSEKENEDDEDDTVGCSSESNSLTKKIGNDDTDQESESDIEGLNHKIDNLKIKDIKSRVFIFKKVSQVIPEQSEKTEFQVRKALSAKKVQFTAISVYIFLKARKD
ncbi:unnamed protein product [Brachionus calyciflorus]|uniref:Uncharacterized protein n=1 Tax=Brachionus calyciflorus TaxID=104777 RepID=A0A814Q1B0_9BILA|nr:unnamed protein product [Brachionus calyciflorus]